MNKPKKNRSAYYYFCENYTPIIEKKYYGIDNHNKMKILARLWDTMHDYEKQPYLDLAIDDKKRYEFELSLQSS
jgi:hypothetical protein